jgi:hypothetical protein
LKRVIMIGDHHQLPPVVKNMAIQQYSHLDQSLFTRFIRLGTPYIELNAQVGRGVAGQTVSPPQGLYPSVDLRWAHHVAPPVSGPLTADDPCCAGPRAPLPGQAVQLAVP